jgi:uncharacterized membrane protein YfcA
MLFTVDLWNLLWGTWTGFFEKILGPGGGNVFFLVPIMVLAMGLWIKNGDKPMLAVVFIIGSCALLGSGNLFFHAYGAALIFLIITALGMTKLIMDAVFNRSVN